LSSDEELSSAEPDPRERWLAELSARAADGSLIGLTLSKPSPKNAKLQNVYGKLVELRAGRHVSLTYRYENRDETKNVPASEAAKQVDELLADPFLEARLFTPGADIALLYNRRRVPRMQRGKPSKRAEPDSGSHDREKRHIVPADRPFLEELGISVNGEVLPSRRGKFRQINKYVEILDGLLRRLQTDSDRDRPHRPLRIVDMGSGRGYLTFALYDYLAGSSQRGGPLAAGVEMLGVELREELVSQANETARRLGFDGLSFEANSILGFQLESVDVLIALHACDTATDMALSRAVGAGAQVCVVAPCCHKQIRNEIRRSESAADTVAPVLRHGILEERQAEIVTDALRALLLEREGYQTRVFEFISHEHTSKNLMITAERGGQGRKEVSAEIDALKALFGVRTHYLETLLER
jgi:hypothetical protein